MDARLLHQAIRSTAATYAVPYLFGLLLLFAVLCFGGSLLATDWLRVLLAIVGVVSTVSAIVFVAYAVMYAPEMLRSEQHVLRMTMAQMIGDKDMDPAVRERLSQAVLDAEDQPRPKSVDPKATRPRGPVQDNSDGK